MSEQVWTGDFEVIKSHPPPPLHYDAQYKIARLWSAWIPLALEIWPSHHRDIVG